MRGSRGCIPGKKRGWELEEGENGGDWEKNGIYKAVERKRKGKTAYFVALGNIYISITSCSKIAKT